MVQHIDQRIQHMGDSDWQNVFKHRIKASSGAHPLLCCVTELEGRKPEVVGVRR